MDFEEPAPRLPGEVQKGQMRARMRTFVLETARSRLGVRSVVTRRRSGSCGSRAQGPLSFSGSKIARRQLSK